MTDTATTHPDGEWLPAHLAMARDILAAPNGATVDTFDGPLIKWGGNLGGIARLSADGRDVRIGMWHTDDQCRPMGGADSWVRYERWSVTGREAHGYVCRRCRHLVQTG